MPNFYRQTNFFFRDRAARRDLNLYRKSMERVIVMYTLNSDNHPELDGTAGQPAIGFWSHPSWKLIKAFRFYSWLEILMFSLLFSEHFHQYLRKPTAAKVPAFDVLHHINCVEVDVKVTHKFPVIAQILYDASWDVALELLVKYFGYSLLEELMWRRYRNS